MSILIVPNTLIEAINAKLDAALMGVPASSSDREHLYHELLRIFDETGTIPDFTVVRRDAPVPEDLGDGRREGR